MMQSSISCSSSSATSSSCTASLQSINSCKTSTRAAMAASAIMMSSSSMQKCYEVQLDCLPKPLSSKQHSTIVAEAAAQGDHGKSSKQGSSQLSKYTYRSNGKTYNTADTFLSLCQSGNDNLNHMQVEENPNPKPGLKTSPTPNWLEYSDCDQLPIEEGQGECDGDHVRSVNGSPALLDHCEDPRMASWRRLSPTAAACFSKDIDEEQEYFQQVLGSSSHGWTDEKHSSYLDSMEAGFLRSVMFKGRVQTTPSSELDDSASSHQAKAAKEFKVCQNGRWRPVCVQAPYANIGPFKQLAVAVKNPWIKRFRASRRTYFPSLILEDPLLEEANARFNSQDQRE